MAIYSASYQADADCREFEAALDAARTEIRRNQEAQRGLTAWREAEDINNNHWETAVAQATTRRDAALTARGLAVTETATADGIQVDLIVRRER